ncbi:MAG: hypothetical protein EOO52_04650 [Gammaproteobacteria bacterium]|nr:MAG: hypothetical protein EOO52_04650 [Gammaproteobacteria bacterium]
MNTGPLTGHGLYVNAHYKFTQVWIQVMIVFRENLRASNELSLLHANLRIAMIYYALLGQLNKKWLI